MAESPLTPGSPGARAGIRTYDLIVAVDGKAVSGNDQLIQLIASRQPGTVASLTSTTHANGFWGTGFLDEVAASPLPASGQVKIDAPGTYAFYCLIHPFMKATVTAS